MTRRNPLKDQIAIVGVGRSDYSRNSGVTAGALVLEACKAAIRDAGVDKAEVDGLCGSEVTNEFVKPALGLGDLSWFTSVPITIGHQVTAAAHAVHSGAADTVLVYHSVYRRAVGSRSAAGDPFRERALLGWFNANTAGWHGTGHLKTEPYGLTHVPAYAAWAGRYLHDYGATREDLGLIAINARANARHNEHALLREPLTMDQYLEGRMIREPLCLYDMDIPLDAANAFVVTTAERARDLPGRTVLIHAATLGQSASIEEQMPDMERSSQAVVARELWQRSDVQLDAVDLYYPYDGFSIITLNWMERLGFCGTGEAGDFMRDNWDPQGGNIKIWGRVPMNSHGGSLSEGATSGAGHVHEAVLQLRGQAGPRQVRGADTALITPGGMFFNSAGIILRGE